MTIMARNKMFPEPALIVDLSKPEGNVFYFLSLLEKSLRNAGVNKADRTRRMKEYRTKSYREIIEEVDQLYGDQIIILTPPDWEID